MDALFLRKGADLRKTIWDVVRLANNRRGLPQLSALLSNTNKSTEAPRRSPHLAAVRPRAFFAQRGCLSQGEKKQAAEKGRMATTVEEWEAVALVGGSFLSIYHLLSVSFDNPPVHALFQSFHAAESLTTLAALAGSALPVLLIPPRAAFLLIHFSLFVIVNACIENMYSEKGGGTSSSSSFSSSPPLLLYASAQMAAHSFLPSGHRLADFLIPVLVSFACMLHAEPGWSAKWAAVPAPSLLVLLSLYSSERGKRFLSAMTLEEQRSGDDAPRRDALVSLLKWAKRSGFVAWCVRISAMEKDAAAISVATMVVANISVLAWTVRSHSKHTEDLQRRNACLAQFCTLPVADTRSDAEPQLSLLSSPPSPVLPVLHRFRDLDSASNDPTYPSNASTTSSSRSDRLRRENVFLKMMLERLRKEQGDLRAQIEAGSKQHPPSTFPRFSAHNLSAYTITHPPFPTASAFSPGARMARRRSV